MLQSWIDRTEKLVKAVDEDKATALSRALDMSVEEYALYQERKSLAYASGQLSLDDANRVYYWLGNSPSTFNRRPLAVKIVLTRLFQELLS